MAQLHFELRSRRRKLQQFVRECNATILHITPVDSTDFQSLLHSLGRYVGAYTSGAA